MTHSTERILTTHVGSLVRPPDLVALLKAHAAGYGVNRRDVMYNDFIVVGPASDPAGLKGGKDVLAGFRKLAGSGSKFISRGDNSGTDVMEKEYWKEIGIETTLRNVPASVFFDGTATSPDSFVRGLADVFMFTSPVSLPDPQVQFEGYTLAEMTGRENGFGGGNAMRYHSPDFDELMERMARTAEPWERVRLAIELNDILIADGVAIPLVHRGSVSAFGNDIQGVGDLNGWDAEYWNIEKWFREG